MILDTARLDAGIKELGVENAYFPCFVSQDDLTEHPPNRFTHLRGTRVVDLSDWDQNCLGSQG